MSNTPTCSYKTDFGLLPLDWSCVPLGELVNHVSYGSSAKSSTKGLIPVLRMGNLQGGFIDWSSLVYTSEQDEINKYSLKKGDVLFNRTNTVDLVGKTSIYRGEQPAIYAGYLIRIDCKEQLLNSEYLNYVLNTHQIKTYNRLVLSVAVSQANINGQKLKTYPIPLPPTLEEQTAIANALSDVDALLSELEKFIAKKQAIKTATMQQLLTGKTRLPQFATYTEGTVEGKSKGKKSSELGEIPEDWEIQNLPEVVWYQEGPGLRNWQFTKKGLKVINITNLQESGFLSLEKTDRHITWEEYEKTYKHFSCDVDDLVIASSGNSYCKSSIVRQIDLPLLMNTSVIRFKAKQGIDRLYMTIYLRSKFFKDQIDLMITGGAQPNFGPFHLNRVLIPLPISKEEQAAIASILSDMDEEIQALQLRLSKTRQIKQGMMQELLTGKARLPFDKAKEQGEAHAD